MDRKDESIIDCLMEDGRITYSDLAKKTMMSDVSVKNRMDRLKGDKIIRAYKPILNFKKMGYNFEAVLNIKTNIGKTGDIASILQRDKRILAVYATVGEFDIIAHMISKDTGDMRDFVENVIGMTNGVLEVRTSLVFNTIKG